MTRRHARLRQALPETSAGPNTLGRRFVTKAWDLWVTPRDGAAAVDTVRIVERTPRVAPLLPRKGIPRARGC